MVHEEERGKCLKQMSIHNRIFERIAMFRSIKIDRLSSHYRHMCHTFLFYNYIDWECRFSIIMHFLFLKYIYMSLAISNVLFYIFSEPLTCFPLLSWLDFICLKRLRRYRWCCAIKAFAKPPKNLSLLIVLFKVREVGLNRKWRCSWWNIHFGLL